MEGVRDREGKEGTGVERVRDRGRRVQMWRERETEGGHRCGESKETHRRWWA